MKKNILVLALLITGFITQAQELVWLTDISKATDLSIKEKKPMMLFFTGSDWCGWCIKLQKDVFKRPEFAVWASQNVILVELDFPRKTVQDEALKAQNQSLKQTLGVRGFPTCWFVTTTKNEAQNKINLQALGSLGYDSSVINWIDSATKFLPVRTEPIVVPKPVKKVKKVKKK